MKNITHFLELWDLKSPEQIATTATSHVYKVKHNNETQILKIYTDLGRNCEGDAPYFFKACQGYGVAKITKFNKDAMLMAFIEGPVLKTLVNQQQDEQATHIIAKTLKSIHAAPQKYNFKFQTLEERFESLFKHAQSSAPDIIKHAANFAEKCLKTQKDIRLLHGDMHHENVIQNKDMEWLAIDPQPVIGDSAYDCANTLHNPHQTPELTENEDRLLKQTKVLGETLNINPKRIINYAYIHGCLSACWSEDDKTETFSKNLSIKTSEILKKHIKSM